MNDNLTPEELKHFRNGVISGLELAIDEIVHVMEDTENDEVFNVLDLVNARLHSERLFRVAELGLLPDDDVFDN